MNTTTDTWYQAAEAPEQTEFGPVTGLSVTGSGEPGGTAYVAALTALYAVAGQVLGLAAEHGRPMPDAWCPLPPLEGRWWVEDDRPALEVPRADWHWHLFLRLPDTADPAWAHQARERALGAGAPRTVARVQLVTVPGGRCVQAMHRGAFADEPRTLAAMDAFMTSAGLVRDGLHHEIYLTDPGHTPPEHARTILRQPVRPA
ncbi:GyrI-like domain-containing protein [Actinophytocola sp.]|uniref:GyrI-like domain-containing protein n=1 Tax=Actinophytocola sp. TaxID=1872138 RepID=UPI002D7E5237|nr:GyrI-like domain-containing protein [Actinophytocola sp.]HET9137774.1 GyrI-like domain-containing protein [Actinophytocola sp.]